MRFPAAGRARACRCRRRECLQRCGKLRGCGSNRFGASGASACHSSPVCRRRRSRARSDRRRRRSRGGRAPGHSIRRAPGSSASGERAVPGAPEPRRPSDRSSRWPSRLHAGASSTSSMMMKCIEMGQQFVGLVSRDFKFQFVAFPVLVTGPGPFGQTVRSPWMRPWALSTRFQAPVPGARSLDRVGDHAAEPAETVLAADCHAAHPCRDRVRRPRRKRLCFRLRRVQLYRSEDAAVYGTVRAAGSAADESSGKRGGRRGVAARVKSVMEQFLAFAGISPSFAGPSHPNYSLDGRQRTVAQEQSKESAMK